MREPSERPTLEEGLAALEAKADAVRLPADSYARLLHKLEGGATSRRRRLMWALSGAAATAALVVAVSWSVRPQLVQGFELAGAARVDESGALEVGEHGATLKVSELSTEIHARAGTRLRREGLGIRVMSGRADFVVQPRRQEPVRVLVSGGVIEVVGTRFTVVQAGALGHVSLEQGVVRFVATDGRQVLMTPGSTVHWPEPAAVAPEEPAAPVSAEPAEAPRGKPARKLPERPPVAEEPPLPQPQLLAEIEALRIRREWQRLTVRLAQALDAKVGEPLRESLSYELCDVLVQHGDDLVRACGRIDEHLRRYPAGAYTKALQQSRGQLRCAP
jgi:transmembrane sensor